MTTSQRQAARKFVECWTFRRGSEKGEDQQFWNSLLGEVLGMEDLKSRIMYQVPVQLKDTTKFLDAWIPETHVLIEHKSRGVNLDAPQSGHGGKTPFQQALEYNQARGLSEKARWIVTCNFDEIWVYDMDRPLDDPQKILLSNLPRELARLGFLVDSSVKSVREKEKGISIRAGRIVGELYKALLKRYANPDSPETLKALNRLCVRLVFLFYAEDADIFPKDAFWSLLRDTPVKFLRKRLIGLFLTLDTPPEMRDPYLEPELASFPYTNGGLFRGIFDAEIPPLDDEIKELLIRSADFDWREISPTIFGALFESTLNPETRRAGGMVYASVENIHKVIDPLFLDDLTRRVDECVAMVPSPSSKKRLLALQAEIAALVFLDPACGSGNFLTESYICLRRLENRIIAALQKGQAELDLGLAIKVSIAQFHGIEINDFAVAVAKTALWIAEAQMRHETAEILHREPDYLPLKDYANIIEGNALRMEWPQADYIMGNPPFSGARWMGKEQKDDMLAVFGKDWQGVGDLDYVTAWYKKAVDCALAAKNAENAKAAFVSTNSICQGGAVVNLWKPLFENGLEIDFAHRTFRWDNESFEKAHVHCVIVGFHVRKETPRVGALATAPQLRASQPQGNRSVSAASDDSELKTKTIFDNGRVIPAAHINGYLLDAPDIFIEKRMAPLCDVPAIFLGGQPIDDGGLTLLEEEKEYLLVREPQAKAFLRPFMMGKDFINRRPRWCLWLKDADISLVRGCPEVMARIRKVREFRLASKRESTLRAAETPALFGAPVELATDYVALPKVSSENRRYIPMDYLSKDVIPGDKLFVMPDASHYHFGVLMSSVHMAWTRATCGRLKSDYSYSNTIVYNNFPWPLCDSAALRDKITEAAQSVLDVRAAHPGATLADLYDPLTMPPDLVKAHAHLDALVDKAYGLKPTATDSDRVALLFKLYAEKTAKEKESCQ